MTHDPASFAFGLFLLASTALLWYGVWRSRTSDDLRSLRQKRGQRAALARVTTRPRSHP